MIDIGSVFIVQILVLLVCFVVLLVTWIQSRHRYMGLGCWALMMGLFCTGYGLYALRNLVSDFISIFLANLLIVAAFIFFHRGVRLFYRMKDSKLLYFAVFICFSILLLYFTYFQPQIRTRVILVSLVYILLLCHLLWTMLFLATPKQRFISKGIIWNVVGIITLNLYRIMVHILFPAEEKNIFDQSIFDRIFLILQVPFVLFLVLSMVVIVSKSLFQEVQEEESKFNSIFHFAPYAVVITSSIDARVVEANQEMLKLLEFPAEELIGHTLLELGTWVDTGLRMSLIDELKSGGVVNCRELIFYTKNKKTIPVLFSATLLTIGGDEFIVSTMKDISEINRLKNKLQEMATHDMLTKLPNRWRFAEICHMQMAGAARSNGKLAMAIFDIDDFKRINDEYCHITGDQVLIGVAERLLAFSRSADLVARYGGDEFTLLLTDIDGRKEAEIALRRLFQAFESPIIIDGIAFYITFSMGASTYPENGSQFEELLMKADQALYVAKRKGKNNIWFASEGD